VSITSPPNNATFTAPANFNIDATAGDTDGTVTQVNFFAGTTLLGTDPASPYHFPWNNVAAGSYTLTATATDNAGTVTTYSPIDITSINSSQGVFIWARWARCATISMGGWE
jgi:hypothetical protein